MTYYQRSGASQRWQALTPGILRRYLGRVRIAYGYAGWLRVDDVSFPRRRSTRSPDRDPLLLPGPLYVRLRPDERGRWRTTEVYLDGRDQPITGEMLRGLPLSAIEALAQSDGDDRILAGKDRSPGVLLSVLASHYATTWADQAAHWVADMWRSQVPDSGVPLAPTTPDEGPQRRPVPVPQLWAPEGGLTDDFLRGVARSYTAAAERGDRRPAVTLAEQTGRSVAAVHKWIRTARSRGIMPPGVAGKVG